MTLSMQTKMTKRGNQLIDVPGNRPVLLNNVLCIYCGACLDKKSRSKEHVIGRRFVPRGKLEASWNLLVWSCRGCNNTKSALEDDISAITMHPDASGSYAKEDEILVAESQRKSSKSISARTGKRVVDSVETINVNVPLGVGISITLSLQAPPQLDRWRVFELARLQLIGFFYWITYDSQSRRGGYWPGNYFPVLEARRPDWGSPILKTFMRTVADWEPRLLSGAELIDGYFKVAIRRHPRLECWSWALEWNHNMRIVGFFGDEGAATDLIAAIVGASAQEPGRSFAFRTEVPLDPNEDFLFC